MPDRFYPLEHWKQYAGPFPLLMFTDDARGFFSWGIKVRTKGYYGHFCYLIGVNEIASQGFRFGVQNLDDYRGAHIKFISNPNWTDQERGILLGKIREDLALPWYRTMYDFLGVVGHAVGVRWLQMPWFSYCSERGSYLGLVDPNYDLFCPTPVELNEWTKASGRYQVTGRYSPE